ncbi:hypothetical protein ANCCAN_09030 [Ancylostoma caninum]|uniref:Uncharacterized protein n=1 Tax=Ancylostoma caninum TaxID=29170 RepID=A0A368GKV0_ANCCA|nr:hypothetical protein ANCCAN_09030 [Ancylostoma caninum]
MSMLNLLIIFEFHGIRMGTNFSPIRQTRFFSKPLKWKIIEPSTHVRRQIRLEPATHL